MKNYLIFSGDELVARYTDNNLEIVNSDLLPFFLKNRPFEMWLQDRAIDGTRPNSRLLKKILNLKTKDDISTSLFSHAAVLTDNYWVREIDEQLSYEDIVFREDSFFEVALLGNKDGYSIKKGRTPELTNNGSYEKGWKKDSDGNWWLYKNDITKYAAFSEICSYDVCRVLNIPVAEYRTVSGKPVFVKSLNFTKNTYVDDVYYDSVNFEPMTAFFDMSVDVDFIDVYQKLLEVCGQKIADRYAQMLYVDCLIFNTDRHEQNYGILRNDVNGDILSFAPLFDHNMTLINDEVIREKPLDAFLEPYLDFFSQIGFNTDAVVDCDALYNQFCKNASSVELDISDSDIKKTVRFVESTEQIIKKSLEKKIPVRHISYER